VSPEPVYPVVLVRHGESTWNERRLVQGQNDDARLTPRGRRQAAEVAEDLRSRDFDVIVSSDLRRASETAAVIGSVLGLAVETDRALRERNFGVAEGTSLDDLSAGVTGITRGVVTDDAVSPEGGETLRALLERAGEFLERRERVSPRQRLLVVTHGGTMRALQCWRDGTPFLGSTWERVDNCAVLTLGPRAGERTVED